jgi:integrase
MKRVARPKRQPGERHSVARYRSAIARACDQAVIPVWNPHAMRQAAASVIRREFGEESARILLGHSKLKTTRLYEEADRAKAIEAMERVG